MTKSERNNAFSKMLKEFPKVFGRVSFRERLMLGVAFDYAITETHDLENKLLGERCNQLLKDRGYLTDKLQGLKETLAQTVENDEVAYETLKLHDQEEIGMLKSRVAELENKIAEIKANCDLAIEGRDVKIKELELELTVEKDQHQEETNLHLHAEEYIKSLEKENAELNRQIEKMKCCQNCKSEDNDYMEKPCCDCSRCLGDIKRKGTSDKWEIKEND